MDEERPGLLYRAVELVARWMNQLGLNGTRLLWRFQRRRANLGETGLKTEILWRSARARHKMCRSCRALVPRGASRCPDCGASLAGVSAPGIGRLLANVVPGITAVTSLVMLVNGFWFVMMALAQVESGGGGIVGFGGELLVRFGAGLSRPQLLPTGEITGGEWWRLVTPIFLHAGLLHFFFNSYLLIQLGPLVEEIYGAKRYWVIYLASGIGGSLASQLPRPVLTVGASGAILGLIGLLLVHGYRSGGVLGQSMRQLTLRLLAYTLIMSLLVRSVRIDHYAHIGGFLTGALLAWLVPAGRDRTGTGRILWQALALAGVILVLVAFYAVARAGRLAPGV